MARVLFIGKYPPIQGGTSAAAYWRIKELINNGIDFEIVTSAVDNDYTTPYLKNDNINFINNKTPWHIPYSQLYSERLVSKGLEIAKIKEIDIVESNYLFPYGFAAYVISKIIHKPLILRHAGSDLYRVSNDFALRMVLKEMTSHAKIIVTNEESKNKWKDIYENVKLVVTPRYIPNPNYFYDTGENQGTAFLGKVTDKWNRQQLDYYYNSLKKLNYRGNINIYSNEKTEIIFKEYFKKRGYLVIGNRFVYPGEVPKILQKTKYLLISEIPIGIPEKSNIYLEGLFSGCIPICKSNHTTKLELDYDEYIKTQKMIYEEFIVYA